MRSSVIAARNRAAEKGFSLIVVAVVTLLLGIALQYGIGFFKLETETEKEVATQKKINYLVTQLAAYAQQFDRVPCPANPSSGNPTNWGFGREDTPVPNGTTNCGLNVGIIPYRTLNIEPSDAIDSWGHYITYAISPVFADIQADGDQAYFRCRTDFWQDAANNKNHDVYKARFCCPPVNEYPPGTDLQITGEAELNRPTTDIAHVDVRSGGISTGSADAYAIVVVSHGRNGYGAFLGNNTYNRVIISGSAYGDAEDENANRDNVFAIAPRNYIRGERHFDDIIAYRTQSQLISELNGGTCVIP